MNRTELPAKPASRADRLVAAHLNAFTNAVLPVFTQNFAGIALRDRTPDELRELSPIGSRLHGVSPCRARHRHPLD
jgi:hypothetical protein